MYFWSPIPISAVAGHTLIGLDNPVKVMITMMTVFGVKHPVSHFSTIVGQIHCVAPAKG